MKNTLKKVLFSVGTIGLLGAGSIGLVSADDPATPSSNAFGDPTKLGEDGRSAQDSAQTLNVAQKDNQYNTNGLIPTIKRFINWVLGMLSLIALVICLRGGFQMLTAAGDETKYKKGFGILKQAAIALAVIGLSWLFVTLILYLINKSATTGTA